MITREQAEQLVAENDGVCSHCHSVLSIYKYKINEQMATVLKKMRDVERSSGDVNVNFSNINMPYRLESQRTKMRFHGLIVQSVNDEGSKIANTWRITRKGYQFLNGQAIEETVVTFANQVIGHEGGMVTIGEVTKHAGDVFDREAVSEAEASVYAEARTRADDRMMVANYRGRDSGLTKGEEYLIKASKLQLGKPIMVSIVGVSGSAYSYKDIAAFQANWKVTREVVK